MCLHLYYWLRSREIMHLIVSVCSFVSPSVPNLRQRRVIAIKFQSRSTITSPWNWSVCLSGNLRGVVNRFLILKVPDSYNFYTSSNRLVEWMIYLLHYNWNVTFIIILANMTGSSSSEAGEDVGERTKLQRYYMVLYIFTFAYIIFCRDYHF